MLCRIRDLIALIVFNEISENWSNRSSLLFLIALLSTTKKKIEPFSWTKPSLFPNIECFVVVREGCMEFITTNKEGHCRGLHNVPLTINKSCCAIFKLHLLGHYLEVFRNLFFEQFICHWGLQLIYMSTYCQRRCLAGLQTSMRI